MLLGNTTRKKYIWEKWNMIKNSAAWKGSSWKDTTQNMKVKPEKSATKKSATGEKCNRETVDHENSAIWKSCNIKNFPTWKKWDIKLVQQRRIQI